MPAHPPTREHSAPAPLRRVASAVVLTAFAAALEVLAPGRALSAADGGPITVQAAPLKVAAGQEGTLLVTITMEKNYALMAPPPPNKFSTAATLILQSGEGLTPLAPVYPVGKKVTEEDSFEYHSYEGEITVKVPVKVAPGAAAGEHLLKGKFRYQTIHFGQFRKTAVMPVEFKVEVTAAKGGAAGKKEKPAEPSKPATPAKPAPEATPATPSRPAGSATPEKPPTRR